MRLIEIDIGLGNVSCPVSLFSLPEFIADISSSSREFLVSCPFGVPMASFLFDVSKLPSAKLAAEQRMVISIGIVVGISVAAIAVLILVAAIAVFVRLRLFGEKSESDIEMASDGTRKCKTEMENDANDGRAGLTEFLTETEVVELKDHAGP
jgi:hypothetical protein